MAGPHLLDAPFQTFGDLLLRRVAPVLAKKLAESLAHLPDPLGHVHGNPDRAPLVRHRALHSLPDPPGRVGREAEAAVGVVLLDGLHQAYVALLDEVLEGKPHPLVLLGHRDDQPEVALY